MPSILNLKTYAEEYNIPVNEGFFVGSVIEGKGAAQAGIRAGDIILSVDEVAIKNSLTLRVISKVTLNEAS